MATIITYGTFDMFHVGHLRLFKRMRELGSRVIVAVSTDEFNEQKGKRALIPYAERREIIEALVFVDLVISEYSWDQKINDIVKYDVDIFVMGADWAGKFDELNEFCKVVYLDRTAGVCSTDLRCSLDSLLTHDPISPDALKLLETLKRDFK